MLTGDKLLARVKELCSGQKSETENKEFRLSDREMLIEVLDKYVYEMCQLNCSQAAIDAYEALLARLEAGEPIA
jgi:hypothetical protein